MGKAFEQRQPRSLYVEIFSRRVFLEERVQRPLAFGWQLRAHPIDQFALVVPHDIENQEGEGSTAGRLDFVVLKEGDRFLEKHLRSDLGTNERLKMLPYLLLGVRSKRTVPEVLPNEVAVSTGRGFVVGRHLNRVRQDLPLAGDIDHILRRIGWAEEATSSPEVTQLHEEADLIRRGAEGGE